MASISVSVPRKISRYRLPPMKKFSFVLLMLYVGVSLQTFGAPVDSTHATVFNVDSAAQSYIHSLSSEARSQSDSYFEGGYVLQLVDLLYGFIVAFVFLRMGLGKQMKRVSQKVANVHLQNLIYAVLYLLLSWVLSFPLSVYSEYFREHQYGLSNLNFGGWLMESLQGLGVGIILTAPMITLLYLALRKAGKHWWLWGTVGSVVFLMFVLFIGPVFIAPIFNKYEPLEEGPLKREILSMARANSIPAENVYKFDASKQSKRVSANVSGFASTTRISLNDNLLNRCAPAEIKAVMAHEMGHYVLNHIYKMVVELGVLIVLVFALLNWALNKLIGARGTRWGIESMSDIGGLPLLVFVMSAIFFVATPISNTLIRTQEMEADIFGLNAAREPDAFAHVAMLLSEYRKIEPGKWEEIIFFDHPSGKIRVTTAMTWKAEHLNELK
ncbi:MAG: M48 family metallopeptidase [Ignavibacteriales bacterium]|nr:M48 family metallopeptidase [Ignavibacteriales bacterium]